MLSSEARCALRVPAAALAVCVPVVAGHADTATWGRVVARIHRHQGLACKRQETISVQQGAGDADVLSPSQFQTAHLPAASGRQQNDSVGLRNSGVPSHTSLLVGNRPTHPFRLNNWELCGLSKQSCFSRFNYLNAQQCTAA